MTSEALRVLAVCSYPHQAAGTRFRLEQMRAPLERRGVALTISPFLSSEAFANLYRRSRLVGSSAAVLKGVAGRFRELTGLDGFDAVLVQREAALIGPPLFERLAAGGRPMILDLDDPTWIGYDSPTYGRLARVLKWARKNDWLIRNATLVTCGSRAILEHVASRGAAGRLVPTVVDTDLFRPAAARASRVPVVGWVGSHSTSPYLESIVPALRRVAEDTVFRLVIVGAGDVRVDVPGAEVQMRPWSLEREVEDFQQLDLGLYPLADDAWAAGKSGFKAIQYLAVGVPYIATPLGATAEIGVPGKTHLEARTLREWEEALRLLVDDDALRRRMGGECRRHSLERYHLEEVASSFADALFEAAR